MTKIAITGSNGRMGRALIRAVKLNPNVSQGSILNRGDDIKQVLKDFDVLIDFTRPEATLDALSICQNAGKAMVIGTTGLVMMLLRLSIKHQAIYRLYLRRI